MRVAVFGATGRIGRQLVAGCLAQGHLVTAFARTGGQPVTAASLGLTVATGDVRDEQAVAAAVAGQDVVLSVLGAKDISQPVTLHADGIRTILAGMQRYGVRRLIGVGGSGLLQHPSGALRGDVSLAPRLVHAFHDHRNMYQALRESDVDWVLICPGFMPSGQRTGVYRTAIDVWPEGGETISAEDVADFILREVERGEYHRCRVGICY